MNLRSIALVTAIAAVGCAPAQPRPQTAPILGNSERTVEDALSVAAQSLATQGFRVDRDAQRTAVVGWKVTKLNAVGPDVHCNMPLDANPSVVLTVTVIASERGDASELRIDGRARVDVAVGGRPIAAGYGCVSSGVAEERVATALGLDRPTT